MPVPCTCWGSWHSDSVQLSSHTHYFVTLSELAEDQMPSPDQHCNCLLGKCLGENIGRELEKAGRVLEYNTSLTWREKGEREGGWKHFRWPHRQGGLGNHRGVHQLKVQSEEPLVPRNGCALGPMGAACGWHSLPRWWISQSGSRSSLRSVHELGGLQAERWWLQYSAPF